MLLMVEINQQKNLKIIKMASLLRARYKTINGSKKIHCRANMRAFFPEQTHKNSCFDDFGSFVLFFAFGCFYVFVAKFRLTLSATFCKLILFGLIVWLVVKLKPEQVATFARIYTFSFSCLHNNILLLNIQFSKYVFDFALLLNSIN